MSPPDLAAAGQLDVLEELLWHDSSSSAGSQGSSTTWLRDWFLKAALGRVELQLQDCRVQYVAPGQLGPAAAGKPVQLKDAIAISVRSAVLAPAGISSDAAANAASDVAGGGMGAPLGQGEASGTVAASMLLFLQPVWLSCGHHRVFLLQCADCPLRHAVMPCCVCVAYVQGVSGPVQQSS